MTYVATQTIRTTSSRRASRGRGPLNTLMALLNLRKSRNDLADLDAHLLADIGVTENQAKTEANRPVWDVPTTWRL